ncbi:MAG: CinA family protein [Ruminococcaceae bacterium]|nr:CinA family protein [Oscillospiraceae bacterium]
MENEILQIANEVVELLSKNNLTITTAESCTGGMIGAALTEIAGVSSYYKEGIITYSNEAKMKYLKVKEETLKKFGAVSEDTAIQMALGAMQNADSDISVAVTGIAGPDGGTKEKPNGLVYICVKNGNNYTVEKNIFSGNRHSVRVQTVVKALNMVKNTINSWF